MERAYPQHRRTSRGEGLRSFVGPDVAKARHAVAVASVPAEDNYFAAMQRALNSVQLLMQAEE